MAKITVRKDLLPKVGRYADQRPSVAAARKGGRYHLPELEPEEVVQVASAIAKKNARKEASRSSKFVPSEPLTVELSDNTQLRVEISEFEGKWGLSIRKWYKDRASGEWKPSSKGIFLRLDDSVDDGSEEETTSAEWAIMCASGFLDEWRSWRDGMNG